MNYEYLFEAGKLQEPTGREKVTPEHKREVKQTAIVPQVVAFSV